MELKNKLDLANKQIEKIISFLKENEKAFDYMDLKLYDVYFYCDSKDMRDNFPLCYENNNVILSYFNDFCDLEYEFFTEDLRELYDIDFEKIIKQLGRSSSFYLHDLFNFNDLNKNIDYVLTDLYDNINGGYDLYYIDFKDGKLYILDNNDDYFYNDYTEEIENALDYFIDDFYNDVIKNTKDILIVYNAIKYFKENQIEYFKDYLKNEEENLIEKEKEEKAEKEKSENIVKSIQNKYNISVDDMKLLKENLEQ